MIRQNRIMLQVAGSDDLFWHDSALSRNRTKMFRDLGAVAPFEAVRGIEARIENLENRVRFGIPQIGPIRAEFWLKAAPLASLQPSSFQKNGARGVLPNVADENEFLRASRFPRLLSGLFNHEKSFCGRDHRWTPGDIKSQ
jgi:hypothetical protein